ncbi:MAG: hypothetical protein IJH79_16130 [Lentisphaeria bacterium]|nr:hypothetical protein [Lentisphaeria bacterium]
MRKLVLAFAAVCVAAILTGCGHNSIQYGDGVGFDFGINPENWTASMTLRYGKILTAVTRDNVEIELSGNASADTQTGAEKTALSKVGTDGNLKIRIGRQINGAAVDLVKAGASADKVVETLADGKKQ